jgi:gentisate 1,2-dioxygenase
MATATATKADSQHDAQEAVRTAYYDKISKKDLAPLWVVLKDLVPKEPKSTCVPARWRYEEVKQLVHESGTVISAAEAERRVLVLENPAQRGKSRITNTLYAGLQMILPGEIAAAHRHTASAIRFVLDGGGAYTQVDGEKTLMQRGDFVLTANWHAHDHGNTSSEPMIWLDVLDVPTVNFFETGFSEHLGADTQNTARDHLDSLERFGSGVLPDGSDAHRNAISPVINYPYARMRPILERMYRTGDVDKRHGVRVRYVNPYTGGWVMPTMGAHLALLPKNFKGEGYRSTDGTIFVCVEGRGSTKIDGQDYDWTSGDVFVVPPWKQYSHNAAEEAVLFSISDRPAQEALGIWREGH